MPIVSSPASSSVCPFFFCVCQYGLVETVGWHVGNGYSHPELQQKRLDDKKEVTHLVSALNKREMHHYIPVPSVRSILFPSSPPFSFLLHLWQPPTATCRQQRSVNHSTCPRSTGGGRAWLARMQVAHPPGQILRYWCHFLSSNDYIHVCLEE